MLCEPSAVTELTVQNAVADWIAKHKPLSKERRRIQRAALSVRVAWVPLVEEDEELAGAYYPGRPPRIVLCVNWAQKVPGSDAPNIPCVHNLIAHETAHLIDYAMRRYLGHDKALWRMDEELTDLIHLRCGACEATVQGAPQLAHTESGPAPALPPSPQE